MATFLSRNYVILLNPDHACVVRALYHGDRCGLVAQVGMPCGAEWSKTNFMSFCHFAPEDDCCKPSWWLSRPSCTNVFTHG